METRSKTFSDNFWSFGWPWLGTHVYKMTPTALDYHSISYGAHAQCAPFDTVRITSIRQTNRRFSVKLANNREEGVLYRSEKLPTIRQSIRNLAVNFFSNIDGHENPSIQEISHYPTYPFIRRPRDILVDPDFI
ncbi:hypothetical protein TNCV_2154591 [Trichonephila clavipes]|nr:hypothetical protein TNCV_2154591 [Trichonephila clavipes]